MQKEKILKILKKPQYGFTLIELMIAITIISILSGVVIAANTGIQQRARDSQRKNDLTQIQTALELYRQDHTSYPAPVPEAGPQWTVLGSDNVTIIGYLYYGCLDPNVMGTDIFSPYIKTVPMDPKNPTSCTPGTEGQNIYNASCYFYIAFEEAKDFGPGNPLLSKYTLYASLENLSDQQVCSLNKPKNKQGPGKAVQYGGCSGTQYFQIDPFSVSSCASAIYGYWVNSPE